MKKSSVLRLREMGGNGEKKEEMVSSELKHPKGIRKALKCDKHANDLENLA